MFPLICSITQPRSSSSILTAASQAGHSQPIKTPHQKTFLSFFSMSFISSGKQGKQGGGETVLGEGMTL
jgi:hypothetical protein